MSITRHLAIVAFLGLSASSFAADPKSTDRGTSTGSTTTPTDTVGDDDDVTPTTGTVPGTTTGTQTGTQAGTAQGQSGQGYQTSTQVQQHDKSNLSDQEIVGLLQALDRNQVEQAKYVMGKTKNQAVKRYAQSMVSAHDNQSYNNGMSGNSNGMTNTSSNGATGSNNGMHDDVQGGAHDGMYGSNAGTNDTAGNTPLSGDGITVANPTSGQGSVANSTTGATGSSTGYGTAGSQTASAGAMGGTTSGTTTAAAGTSGSQSGSMDSTGAPVGTGYGAAMDSNAKQQIADAGKQELEELRGLSGAELDRAYLANTVQAHQKELDIIDGKLVATAQSPELKQRLMQLRPELRQHLEEAQRLQAQVGSSSSRTNGSK